MKQIMNIDSQSTQEHDYAMRADELRDYCLSLPLVTEKMPFPHFNAAKDIIAFYVNNHIFCFFDIEKLKVVTVRAIPNDIDELKAKSPSHKEC